MKNENLFKRVKQRFTWAVLTICLSLTLTSFNTQNTDFCEGWEDGYCEGWKDVKGRYSICPITPICPIPKIDEDSYRGGYNRGFKAGIRKANG